MLIPTNFTEVTNRLCSQDGIYQEYLVSLQTCEAEYLAVLQMLPAAERETLERYLTLCGELDHRRTQIAASYYAINGAKEFSPDL